MDKLNSAAVLEQNIASCTEQLKAKLEGQGGKRAIVVCGGTGCIANDSVNIQAEIERLIKEHSRGDKVTVNHVGCCGFCSQGPCVKILPPWSGVTWE